MRQPLTWRACTLILVCVQLAQHLRAPHLALPARRRLPPPCSVPHRHVCAGCGRQRGGDAQAAAAALQAAQAQRVRAPVHVGACDLGDWARQCGLGWGWLGDVRGSQGAGVRVGMVSALTAACGAWRRAGACVSIDLTGRAVRAAAGV